MTVLIATFYKFVQLPDYADLQAPLQAICDRHGVKGTILLAVEGINGTIAGAIQGVAAVLAHLRADPRLQGLEHKESTTDAPPFERLKVRLKAELIPLGVTDIDPEHGAGTYVSPQDWNALLEDP
ncbi:MAG: hypothetical protein AAF289_06005, partial [Cyanobacteria bacterium P01_A01_bin.135]